MTIPDCGCWEEKREIVDEEDATYIVNIHYETIPKITKLIGYIRYWRLWQLHCPICGKPAKEV